MPVNLAATILGRPLVSTFTESDIGAVAMGWTILEDGDHVLHFGCNSMISYDGDHWSIDKAANAYAIRGLDLSATGQIWACGVGQIGWFDHSRSDRWEFHSLNSFLPDSMRGTGEMWKAFSTTEGAVFVSDSQLYFWNGRAIKILGLPGARRLSAMRVGHDIYVHHLPSGLYRVDRDRLTLTIPASKLGNAAILWMEPRGSGWLLATSNGLFIYDRDHLEPTSLAASAFIRDNGLTTAIRLNDGRLALGTLKGGILIVSTDGSIDRNLTTLTGLPTNEIFAIGLDHEHGLWATSSACIFRISVEAPVSIIDSTSGLALPCESIAAYPNGLALATGTTVMVLDEASGIIDTIPDQQRHVWSLLNGPKGLVVSGTFGLDLIEAGVAKPIYRDTQDAFAIAGSRNLGVNLISVGRSIVEVNLTSGEKNIIADDLPDIATSIAEDNFGAIWAGTTAAGLLKIVRHHPTIAITRDALPGAKLPNIGEASVAVTLDGKLFVFAANSGWALSATGSRFEQIEKFPLAHVLASTISSDSHSLLTIQLEDAAKGAILGRVRFENNRAMWTPEYVEGTWRIGTPTCLFNEKENQADVLWIGGTGGVLRAELEANHKMPKPPKPSVTILKRTKDADNNYEIVDGPISYATNDVVLKFAAASFTARQSIRCETKIDGIDAQWIPIDSLGFRRLVAMKDGKYVVHTRTTLGIESIENVIGFTVRPPWWREWHFDIFFCLILFAFGFTMYRVRLKNISRRALSLEGIVKQRTRELEDSNAAKAEFVANISHDIRNPLNGIVGLTFALEDSGPDPRQSELIQSVRKCANFLSSLVSDVLDLSEIEAGRAPICPVRYSPRVLLEEVVAITGQEASLMGANLVVDVSPKIPQMLIGDAERIQQILVNYTTNAIKHAGGTIVLSATNVGQDGSEIEYTVRDRGPGLSRSDQKSAFNRFQKLGNASNGSPLGHGLGLSVCRSLADLLGATVGVVSEVDCGAVFFLRVKRENHAASESPPLSVREVPKRVLLVEDSDYSAWAISAVLERVGVRVTLRAKTIEGAIKALNEGSFDLIFLDRTLPDGDGIEICKRLRAIEHGMTRAKIIAVTASSTIAERRLCIAAGMDGFIGKPVTPDKIRAALFAEPGQSSEASGSRRYSLCKKLNYSLIRYLSDGTLDGYERELKRFLDVLLAEKAALTIASEKNDKESLARTAHRLRSHAEFIGAQRLSSLTAVLERKTKHNGAIIERQMLKAVLFSIDELVVAIHYALAKSRGD